MIATWEGGKPKQLNKMDILTEIRRNPIEDLKKQREVRHTELFNKVGLFFAFNTEQFNEGKTKYPLREGEKYVHIGSGGYMPKFNLSEFEQGMKAINKWYNSQIRMVKNGKDEHILHELNNHECFYTGDISPVLGVLPYSKEDIMRVFNKNNI